MLPSATETIRTGRATMNRTPLTREQKLAALKALTDLALDLRRREREWRDRLPALARRQAG